MENSVNDIEMRRLANMAATALNEEDDHLALIISRAIVDEYLNTPDFSEADLDVADALLNILETAGDLPKALEVVKKQRKLKGLPILKFGARKPDGQAPPESFRHVIPPTQFDDNLYHKDWLDMEFYVHIDGIGEQPDHPCKLTWLASESYVRSFRTALDIGCREGVYSRYLQNNFAHVYSFDARKLEHFSYNVDLSKVTHFTCALGDENTEIRMSGGTHRQIDGRMWTAPCYRLDEFEIPDVDYIKIDVEGFEEKVIKGGMKTIEASWPLIVIEQNEVCLPGDDQFAAKYFLEDVGYAHVASGPAGIDLIMQKK